MLLIRSNISAQMPCYAWTVAGNTKSTSSRIGTGKAAIAAVAVLFFIAVIVVAPVACRKQEQEVAGAAKHAEQAAVQAEQNAQAAATQSADQRSALAHIPLPDKSLYINIHQPAQWKNPFLTVGTDQIDLRIILEDANPSPLGAGTLLRPEGARRQEMRIRLADLPKALIALPDGAWRYGRVVAIAESPDATRKQRPAIRRNMEAAIQQLNDLGIVVEEWPSH
jgi:hypothetical protein